MTITEETGKRFRDGEHSYCYELVSAMKKQWNYNKAADGEQISGKPARLFSGIRYRV